MSETPRVDKNSVVNAGRLRMRDRAEFKNVKATVLKVMDLNLPAPDPETNEKPK
jgi:hypothetical protein